MSDRRSLSDLVSRHRIRSAASRKAAQTLKAMKMAQGIRPTCSLCRGPRETRHYYCNACRACYMRGWRRKRETSRETPLKRAA